MGEVPLQGDVMTPAILHGTVSPHSNGSDRASNGSFQPLMFTPGGAAGRGGDEIRGRILRGGLFLMSEVPLYARPFEGYPINGWEGVSQGIAKLIRPPYQVYTRWRGWRGRW